MTADPVKATPVLYELFLPEKEQKGRRVWVCVCCLQSLALEQIEG